MRLRDVPVSLSILTQVLAERVQPHEILVLDGDDETLVLPVPDEHVEVSDASIDFSGTAYDISKTVTLQVTNVDSDVQSFDLSVDRAEVEVAPVQLTLAPGGSASVSLTYLPEPVLLVGDRKSLENSAKPARE